MMLHLFAALAVLLLYGQCYAESTSGSKVDYYLLNTFEALIKHRPGLKNYVTFNDEQMSFTLTGSSGNISGYLISETGNLEMGMGPIDLKANLTGHQSLSFNISGVAVDFEFLWSMQQRYYLLDLKIPALKKSSQQFRSIDKFVLSYYQNGEFSANGTFFDSTSEAIPYNHNNEKLPELKGIAAKDGKKLISFALRWTNQESDFQLNFGKGISLAKIKPPTSSKPSDGSSSVLGQSLVNNSTTEGAASAGLAWYCILGIVGVAIFLIVGPITIVVVCFGIMWFEKKKASKNSDPSPNLTPGTTATPATAPPNEELEAQLQSTQSLSVAPPLQAADDPDIKTARTYVNQMECDDPNYETVEIDGYYQRIRKVKKEDQVDAQKEAKKTAVADKNGQAKKPPTLGETTAVPAAFPPRPTTAMKDSISAVPK